MCTGRRHLSTYFQDRTFYKFKIEWYAIFVWFKKNETWSDRGQIEPRPNDCRLRVHACGILKDIFSKTSKISISSLWIMQEKICSSNPYGGVSSDNHLLVACDSGAALKSSQINIIFFGCLEQEERVRTLYSRYTQYSSPPDIQKESAKKITLNLKHHNFEYKIQKSNSKTII